jgi:hypothetical protein
MTMRTYAYLLAVALVACLGTLTFVQWAFVQEAAAQRWGNTNDYRASTVGESHARGMADMVRSGGQAALDSSEAAINLTQARSAQIDNQYQWTQTYFAMQEENRRARAAKRMPRPTEEQLIRFAHAGMPKPLTSEQLDPATGQIGWTRELRREPFAIDRDVLEPIFGRRAASNGVVSDDDYDKIQELVADMQRDLKQRVKKVSANEYIASKRLLESLAYEAKL